MARHIVGDVLVLPVGPVKSLACNAMEPGDTEINSADAQQDTKTAPPAVEALK